MATPSSRRVISPTGKDKTLTPVRPNVGIQADYRRRLVTLITAMNDSIVAELTTAFPQISSEMAMDLSRASHMRITVKRLMRRWTRTFNDMAPKLASAFVGAATDRSDAGLKASLKAAGMTVEFKLNQAANNVLQATIHENVALIRSIASQHLTHVETLVAQSVSQGRDLGWLTEQLQERYGLTKKRAAFISLDQNNKVTSAIQRVRQECLGVTEAIWKHSHAGRVPRPSHVAHDGKKYSIKDGALIDGKLIWPGTEPRCRCVSCPIIPGLQADSPKG